MAVAVGRWRFVDDRRRRSSLLFFRSLIVVEIVIACCSCRLLPELANESGPMVDVEEDVVAPWRTTVESGALLVTGDSADAGNDTGDGDQKRRTNENGREISRDPNDPKISVAEADNHILRHNKDKDDGAGLIDGANSEIAKCSEGIPEVPRKEFHPDTSEKAYERMNRHRKELESFMCKHPQPEAVRLADVHRLRASRTYHPEFTVVHRCRPTSGCCPHGEICAKKSSSKIRRSFIEEIIPEKSADEYTARVLKIREFYFENDTACHCMRVQDEPAPASDKQSCVCPRPFDVDPASADCRCYCNPNSTQLYDCLSIAEGTSRLKRHELKCVQHAKCHEPPCRSGSFKNATGLCSCESNTSHGCFETIFKKLPKNDDSPPAGN